MLNKKDAKRTRYWRDLNDILDSVFAFAEVHDLTWKDMARLSGLGYQTVCNLGNRTTVFPGFRTVLLISRGIGYPLTFNVTGNGRVVPKGKDA